ncbi:MAG: antitoxin [Caulobacterales bacterium]
MDEALGGVLTAIASLDICHGIGQNESMTSRRASLFRNGRNQAVRIPREFELPGDEVLITREGDRLILEPARKGGLLSYLAQLKPLEEDFPEIEDLPAEPFDL